MTPEHEFSRPTHPDAVATWPIEFPIYQSHLNAAFNLEAYDPGLAVFHRRMADAIRNRMIEAELGLMNAHPEQRVQHALRARAA